MFLESFWTVLGKFGGGFWGVLFLDIFGGDSYVFEVFGNAAFWVFEALDGPLGLILPAPFLGRSGPKMGPKICKKVVQKVSKTLTNK